MRWTHRRNMALRTLLLILLFVCAFIIFSRQKSNSRELKVNQYQGVVTYAYEDDRPYYICAIESVFGDMKGWRKPQTISICSDVIESNETARILRPGPMEAVYISGRYIGDDSFVKISELKHLDTLHIFSDALTVEGLRHISKSKSLKNLVVSSESIRSEDIQVLASMDGLKVLGVHSSHIDDMSMAHLKNMSSV